MNLKPFTDRSVTLVVLSGGQGAGKSAFARLLAAMHGEGAYVSALADGIRDELSDEFVAVDWWNKGQIHKDQPRPELWGRSIRDMLIERGQQRVAGDPAYWVAKTVSNFVSWGGAAPPGMKKLFVVDDLRKVFERETLANCATIHGWGFLHLHLDGGVPDYDHDRLEKLAHYRVCLGVELP